ncbi:MAG: TIGR04551 family protein [Myxococcaceae bacterium]
MSKLFLVVSVLCALPGFAQTSAPSSESRLEDIRRELEAKFEEKLEEAKRTIRNEMRAQIAAQAATQDFDSGFTQERTRLELFEPNGYLRVRPDLFHRFDLNREADPGGYTIFPRSPASDRERTNAGANMRFRFEPTLNVSEEVRIHTQIDVFDNLVLGSTPDYGFAGSSRNEFSLLSETVIPPRSGINSVSDAIAVKRAWGEVSTPIGIFRFGRMGSHFGLGMLQNDGNCLNCDFGTTVDRIQFVVEPIAGFFVSPLIDFNVEGPTSLRAGELGQPFDLSNSDDAHTLGITAARRDSEAQARARLDQGLSVFNYGFFFQYRAQRNDALGYYQGPFTAEGGDIDPATLRGGYVPRGGQLYIPQIWVKFERKQFRLEFEAAGTFGSIQNRVLTPGSQDDATQNQSLSVVQFGAVLQGEFRLLEGALKLNLEAGFASGDRAYGMGGYAKRRGSGDNGNTAPGDFEGPQYACQSTGGCSDNSIRNFRFARDYRIDLILWREIFNGITDAVYIRPSATYTIAEGFDVFAAVIYSRAIYSESTPSSGNLVEADANLGVEINAGAQYMTDDGFFAGVQYGILFPLPGLRNTAIISANALENAQAVRGYFGVKF